MPVTFPLPTRCIVWLLKIRNTNPNQALELLTSPWLPHPFNPPSPPYPSQIPKWLEMVGCISTALVSVEHATSLRPRSICHLSLECSAVCILQGLRSSSIRNSLTHQPQSLSSLLLWICCTHELHRTYDALSLILDSAKSMMLSSQCMHVHIIIAISKKVHSVDIMMQYPLQ